MVAMLPGEVIGVIEDVVMFGSRQAIISDRGEARDRHLRKSREWLRRRNAHDVVAIHAKHSGGISRNSGQPHRMREARAELIHQGRSESPHIVDGESLHRILRCNREGDGERRHAGAA